MARTKSQLKKLHKELWQWLADNPGMHKGQWPRWNEIMTPINECFVCEYAGEHEDGDVADCRKCPANWGYDNSKTKNIYQPPCLKGKSPYRKWENGASSKHALLVRDAWK